MPSEGRFPVRSLLVCKDRLDVVSESTPALARQCGKARLPLSFEDNWRLPSLERSLKKNKGSGEGGAFRLCGAEPLGRLSGAVEMGLRMP